MVQFVVEKNHAKDGYSVNPVLEKPKSGQNPGVFLINSEKYLGLLQEKQIVTMPLKFRQRSSLVIGKTKMLDNYVGHIDEIYTEEIESSLSQKVESQSILGLLLRPGSEDSTKLLWQGKTPVVHTTAVTEDTFVPYEGNEKLCETVIKKAQFKQSIHI